MIPQRLIDSARSLVGTPYLHQGRTPDGVDCIGFVALAARLAGVDLAAHFSDPGRYGREPSPLFLAITERHSQRIEKPVPGAAILFVWGTQKWPRHVALYTERATIIHADARRRQVVEHGYAGVWVRTTHSIWVHPEFA